MAITYDQVVPWGRSYDEYRRMFSLTEDDLRRCILGCADGPASFNALMARHGQRIISCDPLYQFTAEQINQRIEATYDQVMQQTLQNQDRFVWDVITSPGELARLRLEAMRVFLADYRQGQRDGRYVAAQLPELPFPAASFDLALCSHFLFFYMANLTHRFHEQAFDELCRIAREVRVFPLLTYDAQPCPLVEPIGEYLQQRGCDVCIEKVDYEFQRGGNMMLRIRRIA